MVNGGARSIRTYSELAQEQPIARELSREMEQSPTLESSCRRYLVSCFAMSCTLVLLAAAGLVVAKTMSSGGSRSTEETVLLQAMGAKCYLYSYSYGTVQDSSGTAQGRRLQQVVVPEKTASGARTQRVTQTIVAACRRRRSNSTYGKKKDYGYGHSEQYNAPAYKDYHTPTYGAPTYGKPRSRYLVQNQIQDAETASNGLPASNGSAQVQASESLLATRRAARGIGPSSGLQTEQSSGSQRELVGYGEKLGGYAASLVGYGAQQKHKKWFKRCPAGFECIGEQGQKWGHCEPLTCSGAASITAAPTVV
eukprot:TRINITY_DN4666_c0_g1_i2.p1 TRINITY_DN4666_c0_g1~~TRINITY_DN4666_c0_g1_i2.p1  ORF type:complete len:309 (+),score=27.79 TRINITY_DN4666_c0_g1_i2:74-1000(+)